jgi:hypothetical protein
MTKIILSPFLFLSATGLLISTVIHICALLKVQFEHYNKVFFLGIGVFIVWLPTILAANKLTKDFKQKDYWKAALRGCPSWMKTLFYATGGYALINFIYMIASGKPDRDAVSTARFISGHLLPFYLAAFAVLYSAIRVSELDSLRRCLNGHPVSPSAKFC